MIATAVENKKTAWLGEFPAHWEVLRIKNLFQEMDSGSETGSEELLSVSHYTGVTLKRESLENEDDHVTNAESLVGYKLVQQGDLVINIMLAWNGSLGISPYNGITSPAYCVYRIKGDNNPEYFGYLFSTNLFKAEFRRHSTGIIDSRLRLYSDKFFSIFTVVPPKEEQDKIVQYIKAQEEKINLFIQKKQWFIELLKEQRQSIIDHAVTKGFYNKVKMKSSMIDWLGDVPENWTPYRIKNFVISVESGVSVNGGEKQIENGEKGILKTSCAAFGVFKPEEHKTIEDFDLERACVNPKRNHLIVSRMNTPELVGQCGLVDNDYQDLFLPDRLWQIELNSEIVFPSFIKEYLSSYRIQSKIGTIATGASASMKNLSKEDYLSIKLFLPSIDEQKHIVVHIKTETATIDTAIAKAEREIELIREYKEAMIAEAVMGKEI